MIGKERYKKQTWIKKSISYVLVIAILLGILATDIGNVEAGETTKKVLNIPKIEKNDDMESKQLVTWDCVWFGSYPQKEVTSDEEIYGKLNNATGWSKNEITLDGVKYRRMKKDDATYTTEDEEEYYHWTDATSWHYFKYEKIKWRVLSTTAEGVSNGRVLLLADKVLDTQQYHYLEQDVTWESSSIRNWLNNDFLNSAFTSEEKNAILRKSVTNSDNYCYNTVGGMTTTDRIILLSESDVYLEDSAQMYGFVDDEEVADEARGALCSNYAKAMGAYTDCEEYQGNCMWWLRTPGAFSDCAAVTDFDGFVDMDGLDIDIGTVGVRPALYLNVDSEEWDYAGTVSSDGSCVDYNESQIIYAVKAYVEADEYDAIFTGIQDILSSGLSYDEMNKEMQNYYGSYGITDLKEGVRYASELQKAKRSYLTLMNDELYTASLFTEHYDNSPMMRVSFGLTNFFTNGEIFDWSNPFTYLNMSYPGVEKYKKLLAEFMQINAEEFEVCAYTKQAHKFIEGTADVYSIAERDYFLKTVNSAKTKAEVDEAMKMYFNEAVKVAKKDDKDFLWEWNLEDSKLSEAIGISGDVIKIATTYIDDIKAFWEVEAQLELYEQNKDFLYTVMMAKKAPFDMHVAAVQLISEYEEEYFTPVKNLLKDSIEITTDLMVDYKMISWSAVAGDKIKKMGASGFAKNFFTTLSIGSVCSKWIMKVLLDIPEMTENAADVRGYAYLAEIYKGKLESTKIAFEEDASVENAWKFYDAYNKLYKLRICGEEMMENLYSMEHAIDILKTSGMDQKKEEVTKIKQIVSDSAKFSFEIETGETTELYKQKMVVDCPVDVEIYDEQGKLVETLLDGEEYEGTNQYGKFVTMYLSATGEFVKVAYFNEIADYKIKIHGNDTGKVAYGCYSYDHEEEVEKQQVSKKLSVKKDSIIDVNTGKDTGIYDYDGTGKNLTTVTLYPSKKNLYKETITKPDVSSDISNPNSTQTESGKYVPNSASNTNIEQEKTESILSKNPKLKISAQKGSKKIIIKTEKGTKVKVSLNKNCIKNGKKISKSKAVSPKRNKSGKVVIKLTKKLIKGTVVRVTVSGHGYEKLTKKVKIKK